jgi:hypothetical protein
VAELEMDGARPVRSAIDAGNRHAAKIKKGRDAVAVSLNQNDHKGRG